MRNLPIELVGAVVENVSSTSDLLQLRSVNSTCCDLVTASLFRRVHIKNSVQSAQNCLSILASPSLAVHVHEVVYDQRDHAQFCLLPPSIEDTCDELETADLEDALTETFCSLSDFKNLQGVILNFWPSLRTQSGIEVHENPFWFTTRQTTVLHAVHHAMKSSPMRSLSLNNVVLMSPSYYDFVSSLEQSPLHHFSMSVVANSELGVWSGSKALNNSLSSLLPVSSPTLKSLVLRSPQGLYHSLASQLRSFEYSSLETLVLEKIVFDHTPFADAIEEFIIRHKDTLRRLEIRSCASYVPSATTPIRRWATIWKRLEEELTSLQELVVAHQCYALLDSTRGYIPHPSLPLAPAELAEEDEQQYQQFKDRVNTRLAPAL
ncbi:hypothetical protein PAXRUDRAFT_12313 [Paxillus rubicundulus Ve08.2h10]|uniref:Unplaced genomic scaffold scaffold_314, whole genome shotgun sequence n=1 Tax=Paxillus rubicundulus Ve08.2h10 TaxID=930991 RepID=A0A0D0DW63_9AGAM|nr:hypothetical protein PAXRUDRAFT_12313 [Paxillus rubicundulus Ve08.2h10]